MLRTLMTAALVANFTLQREGSYDLLLAYLRRTKKPLLCVGGYYFVGALFGIRVDNDTYGYEVHLGWNPFAPQIDTCPFYYGLSRTQATALFDAVLSCVPGSVAFEVKRAQSEAEL
jgi:hypothetical protein